MNQQVCLRFHTHENRKLLARLREEKISVFHVRSAVEFGVP